MDKNKIGNQNGASKGGLKLARFLSLSLVLVALLGILTYGVLQVKNTVDLYRSHWPEVQFAVKNDTNGIVKKARLMYEAKIASVAGEIIVNDEKKPADKLVETVINQIEGKK